MKTILLSLFSCSFIINVKARSKVSKKWNLKGGLRFSVTRVKCTLITGLHLKHPSLHDSIALLTSWCIIQRCIQESSLQHARVHIFHILKIICACMLCVRKCVCMWVCACMCVHVRGQLHASGVQRTTYFQHVVSGMKLLFVRLGGKGSYQVSNLIVSSGDCCSALYKSYIEWGE